MNIIVRTTLEQAIEDLKMLANPNVETFELNQLLSDDIEIVLKEIERLKTELQDTKEHLGEYLHEQEEENKRLNNILNELEKWLKEQLMYVNENNVQGGFSTNVEDLEIVEDKIKELKGSDKE